jgi:hypothetical protein
VESALESVSTAYDAFGRCTLAVRLREEGILPTKAAEGTVLYSAGIVNRYWLLCFTDSSHRETL